mgnify:CR=1 FL=1
MARIDGGDQPVTISYNMATRGQVTCRWLVEFENVFELELNLEVVDMDFSVDCSHNQIEVYKDDERFRKVVRVCTAGKRYYKFISNVVMVTFSTNGYTEKLPGNVDFGPNFNVKKFCSIFYNKFPEKSPVYLFYYGKFH